MGKITDISAQKRNKSRVSVFIDGEFVCGLDAVTAVSSRIRIGDEITADELKKLVAESEKNSAFEKAVGYLSASPRSKKEIRTYLLNKGYDLEVVVSTVEKLDAYRYTDDHAYAQSYIRSKSKKYGNFRIAAELRQKGIASDIISELLDENSEDGAVEIARKYLNTHRSADVQKLKRFLSSRGFSWDAIATAVRALDEDGAFSDGADDAAFYGEE
ncbi:MAG: RecX family transcriptional regulator [Roseburia sp.]|nr:RecX family transcriptional regulator [Roseburia sp.]